MTKLLAYGPPSGPFPVGTASGEFVAGRFPSSRPANAAGRRLMARVWYPALSAKGRRRRYFEGDELEVLGYNMTAAVSPSIIKKSWWDELAALETHSHVEAPVRPEPHPTVIFSHGALSHVAQNTVLMEHLASHGYTIWSVAHPGQSAGIVYSDGTHTRFDDSFRDGTMKRDSLDPLRLRLIGDVIERYRNTRKVIGQGLRSELSRRWLEDMIAWVDAIETGHVAGVASDLMSSCDLGRLAYAGMSFGGGAAVPAAQLDERARAAVDIDGPQILSELFDTPARVAVLDLSSDLSIKSRTFGMTGRLPYINEFFYEATATAGMRSDVYRLMIRRAAHLELTDVALVPDHERSFSPGCGQGSGRRILEALNSFVRAFLDRHLMQAGNSFPQLQLDHFPEVTAIDVTSSRSVNAAQPS